jgi:hypothetical protein
MWGLGTALRKQILKKNIDKNCQQIWHKLLPQGEKSTPYTVRIHSTPVWALSIEFQYSDNYQTN